MFGKQDDQNQGLGDVSNISLPGQDNTSPTPQFANPTTPQVAPVQDLSVPELPAETNDQSWPSSASTAPAVPGDLAELKQKALSQLSPLVGHLDQTPEEKFRTTMMMIQAADDQTLIQFRL